MIREYIFDGRIVVGKQEMNYYCPRCGKHIKDYLIISDGLEGEEHTYFIGCDRCKTWISGSNKIDMATLDMRDYHGLSRSYLEDPNEGMGGGSD